MQHNLHVQLIFLDQFNTFNWTPTGAEFVLLLLLFPLVSVLIAFWACHFFSRVLLMSEPAINFNFLLLLLIIYYRRISGLKWNETQKNDRTLIVNWVELILKDLVKWIFVKWVKWLPLPFLGSTRIFLSLSAIINEQASS